MICHGRKVGHLDFLSINIVIFRVATIELLFSEKKNTNQWFIELINIYVDYINHASIFVLASYIHGYRFEL